MRRTVRVKREQRGWFGAGAGMERALGELSDAAFKVFVHVCLRSLSPWLNVSSQFDNDENSSK